MSSKLFNEPEKSERPRHSKNVKKIDDLILDAEIEAQAEINQKLRSNNTRMLLVVLVGVGLFYVVYSAMQNQTLPVPSFLMEETEIAQTQVQQEPTPKPIPFPVTEPAAEETASSPELEESQNEPQNENLVPLENEVLSMIQKNLNEPVSPASNLEPQTAKPIQEKPSHAESNSPFIPEVKPSPVSTNTAVISEPNEKMTIASEPAASRLSEAQSEYFIQVGAFSIKSNADRVIKKLMSGGFSPLVQTRTTRSALYTVFIGGFADKISPQNMMTELRTKGLSPQLKKNSNGSYSIILGKEKSKEKAEALKQKLAGQGIFTSLKKMKIDMRIFIVRVGGFETSSNALEGQKKLENLGYKRTLIRKKT